MRIGMISQWYEPETGSAAHPTAIARALAARGHELKVLTGFPSYPFGRPHDGWRMRWRQRDERDGIALLRVPDLPSHDNSAVRRALTLTSFAVSATAQVGWLRDVDVCLTYLTPATVGIAARALQGLWGVPSVLYVQDLWPESVTASGFIGNRAVEQRVERGIDHYLRGLYRHADSLVGISPAMTATLAQRGKGTPAEVVYNWIDESIFAPAAPSRELPQERRWVMYAGGIGDLQALDTAVRAIALLGDRVDIGLALIGDGVAVPALRVLVAELGVEHRVRFLGHRPMSAMPGLMAEAIAQLIPLRDLPIFRGTVPSKLQASMAAGQPVICAVAGDAADLTRRSGGGLAVPPENAQALAHAFQTLADMSQAERRGLAVNSRRFYESEMSARVGAERLEHLLASAVERRPR
jgi:colanic acid biosynthesis glycosyl transferase WcaI